MESNEHAVEQFAKRFKKPDLTISRVPSNTLRKFHEMASDEEYAKDWGMVLRDLVISKERLDLIEGAIPNAQAIAESIDILQNELVELKEAQQNKEQEPKGKKMLDGKTIKG